MRDDPIWYSVGCPVNASASWDYDVVSYYSSTILCIRTVIVRGSQWWLGRREKTEESGGMHRILGSTP